MRIKLINIVENVLVEALQVDKIVEKTVGDNKPVSYEDYEKIKLVSSNQPVKIIWVISLVVKKILDPTDIYKLEEYLHVFDKNKPLFQQRDLLQIKTAEDYEKWRLKVIEIIDKNKDLKSEEKNNYVNPGKIKNLEDKGIIYHGIAEGYQVFEIPSTLENDEEAWRIYKNILGKAKGGAHIDICTIGSFSHFQTNFKPTPSSYFLMYNLNDEKSPYQFHFESNQLKDRTDADLLP